ncbi:MAG: sialate O-acetylesterase [Rhodospirillales bacterium]
MLWHQGESDARAKTEPKRYKRDFARMLREIQKLGVGAPVFVATATVCQNPGSLGIHRAQQELTRELPAVFCGPNSDLIGREMRYDSCHFTAAGQIVHATMWLDAIKFQQVCAPEPAP